MSVQLPDSWLNEIGAEFEKEYMLKLKSFLLEEKKQYTIYPKSAEIFNAFHLTPFEKVRVVILGQDPYHGANQAHGLCFSVQYGTAVPPSLQNIYKELHSDIGCTIPNHGNLEHWAQQGVLLLNATLTVRANQAGSHQKQGWEIFTDTIIKTLSDKKENLVFLLWGNYAKAKAELIDATKHKVLTAAHPSPFSAHYGFFGCKHFSKTNEHLNSHGLQPVIWQV